MWYVDVVIAGDGTLAAGTLVEVVGDEDPTDLVRQANPNNPNPVLVPLSRMNPDDNTPVVIRSAGIGPLD